MATMSDDAERTCPLCAEEMDLTDLQLKPCKCGYELCIWCWHQIMNMAEKDDTGGKCPACRVPYDKEKIVGMAAGCERIAEISMDRKTKSQKAKTKTLEGRKQLSSVRVIQRNLVYVVGLPMNLADEDLLERREYFAQYGKVLKVSMSRTASGIIQQFPGNTCSVYITYSKEEEAVRCIQSVHGFVLEGKPLKACFGTTKYCHAWVRNVPCNNPDCLYLHEIGSQEDSYTKDEIIHPYLKVEQITSSVNYMHQRSGIVLPPAEDYCPSSSSASASKPIIKSASSITATSGRGSPPNAGSGKSVSLPAAASWGMRTSNQQPVPSLVNDISKQKTEAVSTLAYSSAVAGTTQGPFVHSEMKNRQSFKEENQLNSSKSNSDAFEVLRRHGTVDSQNNASEKFVIRNGDLASSTELSHMQLLTLNDRATSFSQDPTDSSEDIGHPGHEAEASILAVKSIQNLCPDISSTSIQKNTGTEHSGSTRLSTLRSHQLLVRSSNSQGKEHHPVDQHGELFSSPAEGIPTRLNGMHMSREQFDNGTDLIAQQFLKSTSEVENDILSFDNQRLKDPEVVTRSLYRPNHSRSHSFRETLGGINAINVNVDTASLDDNVSDRLLMRQPNDLAISSGFPESLISSSSDVGRKREDSATLLRANEGRHNNMGRFLGDMESNVSTDRGESRIISNILSLDMDALASPQNLARVLGDSNRQSASYATNSLNGQNSNQSRFSFARQEEDNHAAFSVEPSFGGLGHRKSHSSIQDVAENSYLYAGRNRVGNGLTSNNFIESDNFTCSMGLSSNKLSVSRSQISAPPGFSSTNRAPPPGFSSHDRPEHSFESRSGNHLHDSYAFLRNSYQAPQAGAANIPSNGDIEFMDPAILAVGRGTLPGTINNASFDTHSNFPVQLSPFENEARLQLLMQRTLSPHRNMRYTDIGDYSSVNDSYGLSSRLADQSHLSDLSRFAQMSLQQSRSGLPSNGHLDGNSVNMTEILRNERLGFNKLYNGYEDSKVQNSRFGDIYNRTFGI